jgi:hypothetical protein
MLTKASIVMAGVAGAALVLSLAGTAGATVNTSARSSAAARSGHLKSPVTARLSSAQRSSLSAPAWASRGPSAASDSFGNLYVFWKSPSGVLSEGYSAGTGSWNGSSLPQMGTLGSQPTVAISRNQTHDGKNWQYVFWQGGGDKGLWMAYWGANGTWTGPIKIPGMGSLGSEPTAAEDQVTSGQKMVVYWTGADGYVWYAQTNTPNDVSSWSGPFKASNRNNGAKMGPVFAAPSASGTCTVSFACTDDYVYWAQNGVALYRGTYNVDQGQWTSGPTEVQNVVLGSEPSAAMNINNTDQGGTVAWRGSGGTADLWFWTDNNGNLPDNLGMGPLGSAPAIAFDPGSGALFAENWFFWRGTNNDLWDAHTSQTGIKGPYDLQLGPIG